MYNSLNHLTKISSKTLSLISSTSLAQQTRNTFVLKRRYLPIMHKRGAEPRRLRVKHSVYDLVEDTDNQIKKDINVVLLDFVDGIGHKGDVVAVNPYVARNKIIVNQLGVYASPENIAKYKRIVKDNEEDKSKSQHSSVYSELTSKNLSRLVLAIVMNLDNPWTIEKWHVRTSFRKMGFSVPDHAITLPEKPISGPNLDLQNKVFPVTVSINNCEKAIVRCKIFHWTNEVRRAIPIPQNYWVEPYELVFPEDFELVNSLPATFQPN